MAQIPYPEPLTWSNPRRWLEDQRFQPDLPSFFPNTGLLEGGASTSTAAPHRRTQVPGLWWPIDNTNRCYVKRVTTWTEGWVAYHDSRRYKSWPRRMMAPWCRRCSVEQLTSSTPPTVPAGATEIPLEISATHRDGPKARLVSRARSDCGSHITSLSDEALRFSLVRRAQTRGGTRSRVL
jgi:hypothetical protein